MNHIHMNQLQEHRVVEILDGRTERLGHSQAQTIQAAI